MTQLTQEHFDEYLAERLSDQTAKLLSKQATNQEFQAAKEGLKGIKVTLNQHTNVLDGITKNTETWKAESALCVPRNSVTSGGSSNSLPGSASNSNSNIYYPILSLRFKF